MADRKKGCIFCAKAREGKDRKNYILARGKHCFALLNIYPYNNGHLMIAPYKHVPDLVDLTKNEIWEMFEMLKDLQKKLKSKLNPDGFNIGINVGKSAGAGYEQHIHIHLVPRWQGDTNFMPVISNTKVISQSLSLLYNILKSNE